MTPFIGVRISWLTLARNSLLARLAASAVSLARFSSSLDPLPLGHVAAHAGQADGLARGVLEGHPGELVGDRRAGLRLEGDLPLGVARLGRRAQGGQDALALAAGVGHEREEGSPEQLGGGVARRRLALLVPAGQAAVEVEHVEQVGDGFHDVAPLLQRARHFLLAGLELLGHRRQRVGLMLELGGPLRHRPLDLGAGRLEQRLPRGDLVHLAHALHAGGNEEQVFERDPADVLDPAPGAGRRDAVDRLRPEDPPQDVVGDGDRRARHHDPPVTVEGQERERSEDVEVRLGLAPGQVNQQGRHQHLPDRDQVPGHHLARPRQCQEDRQAGDRAAQSERDQERGVPLMPRPDPGLRRDVERRQHRRDPLEAEQARKQAVVPPQHALPLPLEQLARPPVDGLAASVAHHVGGSFWRLHGRHPSPSRGQKKSSTLWKL